MSDQKPFDMGSGPPTYHDLCESLSYCSNQINIVEAIENLFNDWPKFLGRCQLCSYFREIDFSGTTVYS